MNISVTAWVTQAWTALGGNWRWMSWNLFLALIPLALSVWLFRRRRSLSVGGWLGVAIFIAFLPNAPYVLTDIIHLIYDIRRFSSIWVITLALFPQYLIFMVVGFGAYVISLINLGHYLQQRNFKKYIIPAELTLHGLSAVGIYLGRFLRFNSWDFVTQPDALASTIVDDLLARGPVLIMVVTFAIITFLYWIMKQLILGLILRSRQTSNQSNSLSL